MLQAGERVADTTIQRGLREMMHSYSVRSNTINVLERLDDVLGHLYSDLKSYSGGEASG
jgi:hypothetical protein